MQADGTGIQRITTSVAGGCDPYNPDWAA